MRPMTAVVLVLLLLLVFAAPALGDEPASVDTRSVKLAFEQPVKPIAKQTLADLLLPDAGAVLYLLFEGETYEAAAWLLTDDVLGSLDGADRRDLWLLVLDLNKPGFALAGQPFPASPLNIGACWHRDHGVELALTGTTSW